MPHFDNPVWLIENLFERPFSVGTQHNNHYRYCYHNEKYNCYNWELVYCELYAGGKYNNNSGESAYEFSLGLNGLGACATQYSSEYMDVEICRDGFKYNLHFE